MDMNFQPMNQTKLPSALGNNQATLLRPRYLLLAVVILSMLFETQCVTTDAVSKFASQSSQALAQGPAILKDIEESCVRQYMMKRKFPRAPQEQSDLGFGDPALWTELAAGKVVPPACEEDNHVQAGLLAVSRVLTGYFTAISQLASAGKTTVDKDQSKKDSDTASQSGLPKTVQNQTAVLKSVSSIAGVLTRLIEGAYQQKKLAQDLTGAKTDVDMVLSALAKDVVQADYIDIELANERLALTARDQDYLRDWHDFIGWVRLVSDKEKLEHPDVERLDGTIRILFREDWDQQMRLITAKEATAKNYVTALQSIQDGYDKLAGLAKGPGGLKAKDLVSQLQTYSDSLSKLIPSLQRLF